MADDSRTTPVGLFHYARAYRFAAERVLEGERFMHDEQPARAPPSLYRARPKSFPPGERLQRRPARGSRAPLCRVEKGNAGYWVGISTKWTSTF